MPSTYATKLAKLAEEEYDGYGSYHETSPTMQTKIRTYWTSIGLTFPGVSTAWSAVFVSAHVKKAGATSSEFKFAAAHAKFVFAAAKNATNGTGVFRAYSVTDYGPNIGDIIQNNRNGHNYDFSYAKAHDAYESHSAIVVEQGTDGAGRYVRTVGGNEGDKVGDRIVRLKNNGLIKQPTSTPKYYISVIQTLK